VLSASNCIVVSVAICGSRASFASSNAPASASYKAL
jgi:hypothetical protein